jgi:hypothetical protein
VLCSCGSGKTFERCHGDPRNEYARRQALAEARQVAWLFPAVRIRDRDALAEADRLADRLRNADDLPDELLEEAAARLNETEARRLVDEWRSAYPDRWASLVHAAGDAAASERELVMGAIAAAIHERLPTPRELLIELELTKPSPAVALAFVLPPQFLWSYDEARVAAVAPLEAHDEVAVALVRIEHVARVRRLAELVERELPLRGFRRTSSTLARACARVRDDVAFARGVLSLALTGYARRLDESYTTSRN